MYLSAQQVPGIVRSTSRLRKEEISGLGRAGLQQPARRKVMTRNPIASRLLLTVMVITASLAAAQGPSSGEGHVFTAGRLLTNDSIVRLTQADVSQETILHAVDTQPGSYALGVDDIIALKQAGVSDRVLDAILDHSGSGCFPPMMMPMEILLSPPTGNSGGQPQPGPPPTPTPHSSPGTKYPNQIGASSGAGTSAAPVYRYSAGVSNQHQGAKTPSN